MDGLRTTNGGVGHGVLFASRNNLETPGPGSEAKRCLTVTA